MKRYNNLLAQIADTDNLYLAYWRARKGKEAKHEVQRYSSSLMANIAELQKQIVSGVVPEAVYRRFLIYDPKERLICAAPFPQRVLHHALMNVCGPLLDKRQIFDSYACRLGKGTYAALERAHGFYKQYDWCVKMDIRKYFDSVNHLILKQQLFGIFKEEKLLQILYAVIDGYEATNGCGLPIGNLTSQYFANQYLSGLDHYAKETLRIAGYVRYMDDILIFGNDRTLLAQQAQGMRKYLESRLCLQLKVLDLKSTTRSTQFLGYRLRRGALLLSRRSMQRYTQKLRLYHSKFNVGIFSESDLHRHLVPLVGFVARASSKHFCAHALQKAG